MRASFGVASIDARPATACSDAACVPLPQAQGKTAPVTASILAHRNTYITAADFQLLATSGINSVRLGVGYWVMAETQARHFCRQLVSLFSPAAVQFTGRTHFCRCSLAHSGCGCPSDSMASPLGLSHYPVAVQLIVQQSPAGGGGAVCTGRLHVRRRCAEVGRPVRHRRAHRAARGARLAERPGQLRAAPAEPRGLERQATDPQVATESLFVKHPSHTPANISMACVRIRTPATIYVKAGHSLLRHVSDRKM